MDISLIPYPEVHSSKYPDLSLLGRLTDFGFVINLKSRNKEIAAKTKTVKPTDFLIKPFHPLKAKSFFKSESFYKKKRELDWVTGAFFLTRKEIFGGVEQWDKNYFMYFEEVDLCFRAKRLGWRVMYLPQWSILHYGGASGTSEFSTLSEFRGIKRFYKKFYPHWQYPLLRLFLKIGSLARIVALVILEGRESAKIYVKAYKQA